MNFTKLSCKFEIDELWSFIGNKANVTWITYAIERTTKNVVTFFVGNKSKENIKPLIDNILLLNPITIFTDKLNIYLGLIPKKIHKRFRYCTNHIERKKSYFKNTPHIPLLHFIHILWSNFTIAKLSPFLPHTLPDLKTTASTI